MKKSINRKNNSSIEKITKIIPYDEYLQLKKAYINLKENNKKIKEEKQKIESILKEYQLHLTDYKSSNNTIKILFQKVENNYKELNIKNTFKNIYIIKLESFKIINENKNILKSTKNTYINYNNNEQEEVFMKTIKNLRNNNEIITTEYNNAINRYIEVINQLNREIKIKDELFKLKDKNNKSNNLFENLIISNKVCNFNIFKKEKIIKKHLINNSKSLFISSNICEFNILQNFKNQNNLNKKLFISSNKCDISIIQNNSIKKNNLYFLDDKLIFSSNICEINLMKENRKRVFLNETIIVCQNVCKIIILKEEKPQINSNNNLIIESNINDINILSKENIFQNNTSYIISYFEIYIPKIKNISDKIISQNINEISIICNKKLKEDLIILKNIQFNIISENNNKNLMDKNNFNIESNINNINITTKKVINLEICSNISQINILNNTKNIEDIFKIENNYFQIKNREKVKFENLLLENYINTINIGFDSRKKYDNYNNINKEKDDQDSDNENDKLECEPVPSFLLCIQKVKKKEK